MSKSTETGAGPTRAPNHEAVALQQEDYQRHKANVKVDGLFKPRNLNAYQCIARTVRGVQCRGEISEGDLRSASSQMRLLTGSTGENRSLLKTITPLLVCKRHPDWRVQTQLQDLMRIYESDICEYGKICGPLDRVEPRACQRNSATTLLQKLKSPIESNQFEGGVVYLFTWDKQPGFVKIGCAKGLSDRRVAQWAKCYPRLTPNFDMKFDFPQRMEEMIHLELAGKRYEMRCDIRSCRSEYHDEWFKCSVEEAETLVRRWRSRDDEHTLYDLHSRRLTDYWKTPYAIERLLGIPPTSDLDVVGGDLERMSLTSTADNVRDIKADNAS